MRIWILSDLHVAHGQIAKDAPPLVQDADICICAGDTADSADRSAEFLLNKINPNIPVVTVLGNHDCYGNTIDGAIRTVREKTKGTHVRLLENETLAIPGLRVIGATLWTDFEVPFGEEDEITLPARRDYAIYTCRRYMVDFREIYRSTPFGAGFEGLVTSDELISRHQESRAFIEAELAKPFDGKTLVLTHHAPSRSSLDPRYQGDPSIAAFASDLSALIKKGRPHYWVHGHIHKAADYMESSTRIICNPRGYRHERERNGYIPNLIIDV